MRDETDEALDIVWHPDCFLHDNGEGCYELDPLIEVNPANLGDALGNLGDFIDRVERERGKKLTDAQADALIGPVQEVFDSL
jgi:hypothetical protein